MGKPALATKAVVDTKQWHEFLQRMLVRALGEPTRNSRIEYGCYDSEWRRGQQSLGVTIEYGEPRNAFGGWEPPQLNLLLTDSGLSLNLKVTKRGRWLEWTEGDLKDLPRRRGKAGSQLFCLIVRLGKPTRRGWKLTAPQARRIARLLVKVFQA